GKRFDILGRHQSRVVAERLQLAAQVMGADAGLHADEAGWHVGEPGFELPARQLLAQHDGAPLVEANEMEDVLADVDAEHGNGAFGLARHGGLLCSWAPRSMREYCWEHRRSIPLAEAGSISIPASQPDDEVRGLAVCLALAP